MYLQSTKHFSILGFTLYPQLTFVAVIIFVLQIRAEAKRLAQNQIPVSEGNQFPLQVASFFPVPR